MAVELGSDKLSSCCGGVGVIYGVIQNDSYISCDLRVIFKSENVRCNDPFELY